MSQLETHPRLDWLDFDNVRPYVYVREDLRVKNPGSSYDIDWFNNVEPIWFNPLHQEQVEYSNLILNLEAKAFASSGLGMDRWVFYDCAIMPGFVAGFAHKTETLPEAFKKALGKEEIKRKWTPISLFIVIPTMKPGEWFAHNLCSINSLVKKEEKLHGLGFLTKAFGLWYANITNCCGATQWKSPARRLHSLYGDFQLLTTYTPTHTYPKTITYRLDVKPERWGKFFWPEPSDSFGENYENTGEKIDPTNEADLIAWQDKIQTGGGPYYLKSYEVLSEPLEGPYSIYRPKT